MKANPGGPADPGNVVGRDHFIKRLWETLDQLGVVLVAERRMGKTSIINKMRAEADKNTLVLLSNVQGVSKVHEFVEIIARDIKSHLSAAKRTASWLKNLWSALGGTEIAGVFKLPAAKQGDWKILIERLCENIMKHQNGKVIFIWDELPWMLQKIKKEEGIGQVVDLLDVLRAQRQNFKNLRMVFTGSIGLHHVITGMHEGGYAASAVNDMRQVEVPPLEIANAAALALELFKGEGFEVERAEESASLIAELVEGVPYYVHHVVASLADQHRKVTVEMVKNTVLNAIIDANDPWNLDHYRDRLADYYGERAGLVTVILDVLTEAPLSLRGLHERLRVSVPANDKSAQAILKEDLEKLRALIRLMQRDHYLQRTEAGKLDFRFALIRRWWMKARDLE